MQTLPTLRAKYVNSVPKGNLDPTLPLLLATETHTDNHCFFGVKRGEPVTTKLSSHNLKGVWSAVHSKKFRAKFEIWTECSALALFDKIAPPPPYKTPQTHFRNQEGISRPVQTCRQIPHPEITSATLQHKKPPQPLTIDFPPLDLLHSHL